MDDGTARRLRAHYELDTPATSPASTAAYLLGALLVAAGVISFVAWNWHALNFASRLLLAGTATVAAQSLGHFLWKSTDRRPLLGHALLFLGALLFGAVLFVIEKSHQMTLDRTMALGVWSASALTAAWAYRSVPIAALSLVLGLFFAATLNHPAPSIPFVPLLAWLTIGPLVYFARSRFLAAVLAFGTAILIGFGLGDSGPAAVFAGVLTWAGALIAGPFLAGSIDATRDEARNEMLGAAAACGFVLFGIFTFAASFHELGNELSFVTGPDRHREQSPLRLLWIAVPCLLVIARGLLEGRRGRALAERPATLAALAGVVLVTLTFVPDRSSWLVPLAAHLALVTTSALAIFRSVQNLERLPFWGGTLALGLLIVARFFEYRSDLLVKAVAFIACGLLVLWAGHAFERNRAARVAPINGPEAP